MCMCVHNYFMVCCIMYVCVCVCVCVCVHVHTDVHTCASMTVCA